MGSHATALFVAVGLFSTILFSRNGVRAHDVVTWMSASPALRFAMWAGWLTLATPVARLAFRAPGSLYFRSLPIPPRPFALSLAALVVVVQLPWMLLFFTGGGAREAAAAGLLACAIECAIIAGPSRKGPAAILAGAVVVLAWHPLPEARVVAGVALLPLGMRDAWRFAPERGQLAIRLLRRTSPAFVLLLAHAIRLLRIESVRLTRGTVLVCGAGAAFLLSVANDPPDGPEDALRRALMIEVIPIVIVAAGLAEPVFESGAQLRWLTTSTGMSDRALRTTCALSVSICVAAFGALFGAIAFLGSESRLAVAAGAIVWAGLLGAVVYAWAVREIVSRRRRDGSRLVLGFGAIAAAGMMSASFGGGVALATGALAGLGATRFVTRVS